MKQIFLSVYLFIVLLNPQYSFGWGAEGHQIVAGIAAKILDNNTKANVQKYLGNMTFEDASTWMDEVKSDHDYDYMRTWHYINVPKGENYNPTTTDENIVNALLIATNELKHKHVLCDAQIKNDILMLFHLIGDLHQPLHAGYATDRGGNSIKVTFLGTETNLHHVWDSDIIEHEKITLSDRLQAYGNMTINEIEKIKTIDIVAWMQESRSYLDTAYNFTGNSLDAGYSVKNKSLVERRLLYGGIRLAAVLEKYFSGTISATSPPAQPTTANTTTTSNSPVTVTTSSVASSAVSISAEDASKHVGEEATVCSKVYGTKFLEGKNGITFINMGAAYPNSPFTVVIFKTSRSKFSYKPEEFLDGKTICVTGKITQYQGKTQIIANGEEQIKVSK